MEGISSVWEDLKLFATLVGLWGIPGGLFSMSVLPFSPVGQAGKVLYQEMGHVPQPPLWWALCLAQWVYLPCSMTAATIDLTCNSLPHENLLLRIISEYWRLLV